MENSCEEKLYISLQHFNKIYKYVGSWKFAIRTKRKSFGTTPLSVESNEKKKLSENVDQFVSFNAEEKKKDKLLLNAVNCNIHIVHKVKLIASYCFSFSYILFL